MAETTAVRTTSARKGKLKALPFLQIVCPKCGAKPGKTCMLPRWMFGFAHRERREEWLKQQEVSNG